MSEERAGYKADETNQLPAETETPQSETKTPQSETKTPASETEQAGGEKAVTLTEDKYNQLTARVASLTASLAAKDSALTEAKKTLDAQAADIASLSTGNQAAVAAFRRLAVSSNPVFTDELITGSTIEEVEASMQRVNDLAAGIKTRLEAELKETVIPAGAPERSGPDTSGLSPREKIKAGLNK